MWSGLVGTKPSDPCTLALVHDSQFARQKQCLAPHDLCSAESRGAPCRPSTGRSWTDALRGHRSPRCERRHGLRRPWRGRRHGSRNLPPHIWNPAGVSNVRGLGFVPMRVLSGPTISSLISSPHGLLGTGLFILCLLIICGSSGRGSCLKVAAGVHEHGYKQVAASTARCRCANLRVRGRRAACALKRCARAHMYMCAHMWGIG